MILLKVIFADTKSMGETELLILELGRLGGYFSLGAQQNEAYMRCTD
jgi:hypothetical protein